MGHIVTIPAETYVPTDATAIPTVEFKPVAGNVFDFRTPHAVGERVRDAFDQQIVSGRGSDHNWVIGRKETSDEPRMAKGRARECGSQEEMGEGEKGGGTGRD